MNNRTPFPESKAAPHTDADRLSEASRLSDAMQYIDDDIIEETDAIRSGRKTVPVRGNAGSGKTGGSSRGGGFRIPPAYRGALIAAAVLLAVGVGYFGPSMLRKSSTGSVAQEAAVAEDAAEKTADTEEKALANGVMEEAAAEESMQMTEAAAEEAPAMPEQAAVEAPPAEAETEEAAEVTDDGIPVEEYAEDGEEIPEEEYEDEIPEEEYIEEDTVSAGAGNNGASAGNGSAGQAVSAGAGSMVCVNGTVYAGTGDTYTSAGALPEADPEYLGSVSGVTGNGAEPSKNLQTNDSSLKDAAVYKTSDGMLLVKQGDVWMAFLPVEEYGN